MKTALIALTLLLGCSSASAIDISEATLNTYVARKLAEKRHRDVEVKDPKITLLDGYATLCATLRSKVIAGDIDFCADMTPKWRPETGSLLATHMALVSLNAPGVKEADAGLLKTLLNQVVLPRLEGVEVYKAEGYIGKQISEVKVLPGRLDISM